MSLGREPDRVAPPAGLSIDDISFKRLSRIVYADSGIVLNESKKCLLVSRLSRRLRDLGLSGFPAYCDLLDRAGQDERAALISLVTTNVTRFFREIHHFKALSATCCRT